MKIDVEGGELAAIRGAMRTISQSRTVIVALEAHPSVVRRTGVDPVHCLRLLSSFRPFHYYCSEGESRSTPVLPCLIRLLRTKSIILLQDLTNPAGTMTYSTRRLRAKE